MTDMTDNSPYAFLIVYGLYETSNIIHPVYVKASKAYGKTRKDKLRAFFHEVMCEKYK